MLHCCFLYPIRLNVKHFNSLVQFHLDVHEIGSKKNFHYHFCVLMSLNILKYSAIRHCFDPVF